MMKYKEFNKEEFGLSLHYPEYWQLNIEEDGTFLFKDETAGNFRISFVPIENSSFDVVTFLEQEFNDNINSDPFWKKLGDYMFLCYIIDAEHEANTKIHQYISGGNDFLLICSYAFDKELNNNAEVKEGLLEVEKTLSSISIQK